MLQFSFLEYEEPGCVSLGSNCSVFLFFSVESEGRALGCLAKSFLKAKFDTGSDMANTNLLTFH